MELRQLEAFVTLADELHFGRAAARLHLSTPTLSELIRRLETELGAPLFTRTTRRVSLTGAGTELLGRAKAILADAAAASAAVRRVTSGELGTVRLGITPPAGPVLAPHLVARMAEEAPEVTVDLRRMWLPALSEALQAGEIDVALTCGTAPQVPGTRSELVAAEELLVGLRLAHPLATRETLALEELADQVLGMPPPPLFPAWAACVAEALTAAGVDPPTLELTGTELSGERWTSQAHVDWVVLIGSLTSDRPATSSIVRRVQPRLLVPFSLRWNPEAPGTTAIARFVDIALAAEPPTGWFRPRPGRR